MAETKFNPLLTASSGPLKKDPEQIKWLKEQGLEVPEPDVVWGEDLGPMLKKNGRLTNNADRTSKPPRMQTTSDLTASDPVKTT